VPKHHEAGTEKIPFMLTFTPDEKWSASHSGYLIPEKDPPPIQGMMMVMMMKKMNKKSWPLLWSESSSPSQLATVLTVMCGHY
jgi:hypothetical protein